MLANESIYVEPNELLTYCDEKGYLSNEARNKYLVDKKVISLKYGDILVKQSSDGSFMYPKMMTGIDAALNKIHKKKAGSMGVSNTDNVVSNLKAPTVIVEDNLSNTIHADEIDF